MNETYRVRLTVDISANGADKWVELQSVDLARYDDADDDGAELSSIEAAKAASMAFDAVHRLWTAR